MSIDFIATVELIRLLNDSEYTQKQLQELTGMSNSIGRWIRTLHAKQLIYICGWHRTGKIKVPIWTWGFECLDKQKPRALTSKEYNARARAKRKLFLLSQSKTNERKLSNDGN